MALPKPKQDAAPQAEAGTHPEDAVRPEPGPAGEGHAAFASPARRLQARLHFELEAAQMPSARQTLAMSLILSLACAVAALGLLGGNLA